MDIFINSKIDLDIQRTTMRRCKSHLYVIHKDDEKQTIEMCKIKFYRRIIYTF